MLNNQEDSTMVNVKFDRQEIDEVYMVLEKELKQSDDYHLKTAFIAICLDAGMCKTEEDAYKRIDEIQSNG